MSSSLDRHTKVKEKKRKRLGRCGPPRKQSSWFLPTPANNLLKGREGLGTKKGKVKKDKKNRYAEEKKRGTG